MDCDMSTSLPLRLLSFESLVSVTGSAISEMKKCAHWSYCCYVNDSNLGLKVKECLTIFSPAQIVKHMTKYGRGPSLFLIKVFLLDECPGIIIERCWPRGIRQKCVYLCTVLIARECKCKCKHRNNCKCCPCHFLFNGRFECWYCWSQLSEM